MIDFDHIADIAATSDAASRTLDGLAFRRLEAGNGEKWLEYDVDGEPDVHVCIDDDGGMSTPPRYSASLDVVKSILTPRMRLVRLGVDEPGPEHLYEARRPARCEIEIVGDDREPASYAENGATLELAFMAAAMRAHGHVASERAA